MQIGDAVRLIKAGNSSNGIVNSVGHDPTGEEFVNLVVVSPRVGDEGTYGRLSEVEQQVYGPGTDPTTGAARTRYFEPLEAVQTSAPAPAATAAPEPAPPAAAPTHTATNTDPAPPTVQYCYHCGAAIDGTQAHCTRCGTRTDAAPGGRFGRGV